MKIKDIKYTRELNEDITELTASIKELGLKVPILVTMDHKLIDGLNRLKAIESLGHETIECKEVILTDAQVMELQIISSVRRVRTSKEDWIKHLKKYCSKSSNTLDQELIDYLYENNEGPHYVTKEQYDWVQLTGLDKIFGKFKIK